MNMAPDNSPAEPAAAKKPDNFLRRVFRTGADATPNGQLDMRHYFSRYVLVHTHVAKTGGSSFVSGLRDIFGEDHVYDTRGGFPNPFKMPPERVRQIWCLSGHFWFDTQERPIVRQKRYIMNIRDPVDRFISLYNYVAAAKAHPGHNKYGILDIEDAFRYLKENSPNAMANSISLMFGDRVRSLRPRMPGRVVRPQRPVSFEEARAAMEKHFALVVPMNRLNEALSGLGKVFGVDLPAPVHHNIGTKKVTALSEETQQELREMNAVDLQLIAHFESMFDEHLKNLSARLLG
jgi:hypothetical protein